MESFFIDQGRITKLKTNMINKNYILWITICCVLLIIFLQIPQHEKNIPAENPTEIIERVSYPILSVDEKWQTYTDKELGFSIKYPPGTVPEKVENGVLFLEPDTGFGWSNVTVSNFVDGERFKFNSQRNTLEKTLKINGYDAIVFYPHDDVESFPYEKTLEVQKDNRVYFIYARGTNLDFDSVWNSFKFLETGWE